ncbi:MAG TPA: nicotinamide riboside transporter PnuC [Flavisolibacter sp.]|jgi:nicotinamide mononucleotide transporter|nr:nicotinamide riboside transporter PnuC [Flavisolibacter sp.]
MSAVEIWNQFLQGMQQTSLLEYLAVFTGIASVWFSRKENILVYPVGLVNTVIYVYLSFKFHLLGEASVNFYYTVMSVYGWYLWTRKDREQHPVLHITFSSGRQWLEQVGFFLFFYVTVYVALFYLKQKFAPGAIPWADAFASATAFTGMWLMAKKKVESWHWWIATDLASIPLYFVKGLVFTSVYYIVLTGLAIAGLLEWRRKALHEQKKHLQVGTTVN